MKSIILLVLSNLSILSSSVSGSLASSEDYYNLVYKEKNMAKSAKSPQMSDMAVLINKFNFNFNAIIAKDTPGNIMYSPFSIYSALAMLGVGAVDNTKKEIANALGWHGDNFIPLLEKLGPLFTGLSKDGAGGTKLDIANKAWVGENADILQSYQDNVKKYFGVELGKEKFTKDPETSRKNINEWVESKTGHNIKELFTPGSIEKMTQLVIANAVYFKGEWQSKFDVEDTYENDFYISKDETVKVEFMFRHDKVSTAVDKEHKLQLLELPYAGGMFSIIFAIPLTEEDMNGGMGRFEDLSQVEATIKDKTKTFEKWIANLPDIEKVKSEIDIMVPKFEIQHNVDLLTQLQKLGINDVFVPGGADLSAINGKKDLYVSSAAHKAFMKVDEEGTTAAAATGFAANTFSMGLEQEEVLLNHPFLFYIIHKDSMSIIFSGKVQNPLS